MVRQNKGIPVERTFPGVLAWEPNSTIPFTLDNNLLYEELVFQLSGSLTLAGYTAAPTIRAEGLENLVSLFTLTGNAKQNGAQAVRLSAVDLAYMRFKSNVIAGTETDRVDVSNGNATYDFYTTVTKFFGAVGVQNIYDASYFDSRLMSTFAAQLNTRDINALVKPGTGANGTATLANVQGTFHARGWEGANVAASAPYIRETTRQFNVANLPALDADFPNMPIGNIITRQTFKGCVGDVDYADPSDGFFTTNLRQEGAHVKTTLTGQGGSKTPFDVTYDHLTALDKTKYRQEAWPEGYATIEYSRDGQPKNLLDLRRMLSAKNTLDVTPVAGQTNTLYITDEELVLG